MGSIHRLALLAEARRGDLRMTAVTSGQSEGTVEVTPSGIPIYFASKPKRLYRIGPKAAWMQEHLGFLLASAQELRSVEAALGAMHVVSISETGWKEVPSVTTVLGVLDKPALPWWGMKCGVEGVLA